MEEVWLVTNTVDGYAWVGSAQQILDFLMLNEIENVNFSKWEYDKDNDCWDQMTS